MLMWEQKRGKVDVTDDVVSSTIIFYFERDDVRFSLSDTQGGTQGDSTEKSSQESGQKSGQRLSQKTRELFELLKKNPYITRKELSALLHISPSAIQKHIEKLKKGYILRIGPDKAGYWEIIPTD